MLWHAYTHQRECFDVAVVLDARFLSGPVTNARVTLDGSPCLPLVRRLREPDTRGPPVVPDADNLEHVSTLQLELVISSGLVCPENGDGIVRMYVLLGVVIFEELQLLGLTRSDTFWAREVPVRIRSRVG